MDFIIPWTSGSGRTDTQATTSAYVPASSFVTVYVSHLFACGSVQMCEADGIRARASVPASPESETVVRQKANAAQGSHWVCFCLSSGHTSALPCDTLASFVYTLCDLYRKGSV